MHPPGRIRSQTLIFEAQGGLRPGQGMRVRLPGLLVLLPGLLHPLLRPRPGRVTGAATCGTGNRRGVLAAALTADLDLELKRRGFRQRPTRAVAALKSRSASIQTLPSRAGFRTREPGRGALLPVHPAPPNPPQ